METDRNRCGWLGSINEFQGLKEESFSASLKSHHNACMNIPADPSQITAWENCYSALQHAFTNLLLIRPDATSWTLIFEYELPRERGRRPDVILFSRNQIFVLEFKDFARPRQAHIDQVAAYVRDLQYYHALSHQNPVIPLLVLTKAKNLCYQDEQVNIVSPDQLAGLVTYLIHEEDYPAIAPIEWVQADYAPLPSLITAARNIFNHEPLPQIRRAQSVGIPLTIEELQGIARQARDRNEHHLALVTGVPGAGKTLVGLQFVYSDAYEEDRNGRSAIFLSGNGPLVKVLQHALKSNIFVRDVHGFLKEYGGTSIRNPEESIFIYDEAQRAWDENRVSEKRGKAVSEPEDFLRIGSRKPWSLMIGLIGEGQEIHLGEEAGLKQWNTAIAKIRGGWIVHCPRKIVSLFTAAGKTNTSERLNLTASLRSHLAEDVQEWVRLFLDGELSHANAQHTKIVREYFNIYVTRNLELAQTYARDRYQQEKDKRFGLLASSKAANLSQYGIHNEYQFTKNFREGPWYNDDPSSTNSCCQLREVATEFACQGLELDFPIVCWGDDLIWRSGRWVSVPQPRSKAHDPHQLRLNSYRVLLTRGRDGFVMFVPPTPEMDSTYQAIRAAGVSELSDSVAA